jgi:hypothetical protein
MNTFNENIPGAGGSGPGMEPVKTGFWANLKIIEPVTWTIAIVVFAGMEALFWFVLWPHRSHQDNLDKLPALGLIFLPLLTSSLLFVYVLLIGFVRVDAKRRGMRYVLWTLLAIFIGNGIGIILYFILRDPLPTPCPKCGFMAKASFSFCPRCSTELFRACKVCHKKLDPGWANCAYCGAPIGNQPARVG